MHNLTKIDKFLVAIGILGMTITLVYLIASANRIYVLGRIIGEMDAEATLQLINRNHKALIGAFVSQMCFMVLIFRQLRRIGTDSRIRPHEVSAPGETVASHSR